MGMNLKNKNLNKLLQCRICNSNEILPILDLGNQPLANSLKKEKTQSENFFLWKYVNVKIVQLFN